MSPAFTVITQMKDQTRGAQSLCNSLKVRYRTYKKALQNPPMVIMLKIYLLASYLKVL